MDFDLIAATDEGLRASMSEFGAPSHWRFSDLGKCNRCQVLKRLGFKQLEKRSFKSNFILQMGNVIEREALVWISRSTNVDILATQVKVNLYQYDAKGTLDALARIGNYLAPIEVKSTRDKALEYRIPYHNHELQAGGYAWALNLPGSFLVYFGRDGATAQAWVDNSQALRDEIANQWETLNLYWDSMPVREDMRVWVDQGPEGPGFYQGGMEIDADFYQRVSPFLPPAPKAVVRPILDKLGQPSYYQRAGPWGPKGTPKTELSNDGSCTYCPYPGYCCVDVEEDVPTTDLVLPDNILSGSPDGAIYTKPFEGVSLPKPYLISDIREESPGRDIPNSRVRSSEENFAARLKTKEGWVEIPQESWIDDTNQGTQAIS